MNECKNKCMNAKQELPNASMKLSKLIFLKETHRAWCRSPGTSSWVARAPPTPADSRPDWLSAPARASLPLPTAPRPPRARLSRSPRTENRAERVRAERVHTPSRNRPPPAHPNRRSAPGLVRQASPGPGGPISPPASPELGLNCARRNAQRPNGRVTSPMGRAAPAPAHTALVRHEKGCPRAIRDHGHLSWQPVASAL